MLRKVFRNPWHCRTPLSPKPLLQPLKCRVAQGAKVGPDVLEKIDLLEQERDSAADLAQVCYQRSRRLLARIESLQQYADQRRGAGDMAAVETTLLTQAKVQATLAKTISRAKNNHALAARLNDYIALLKEEPLIPFTLEPAPLDSQVNRATNTSIRQLHAVSDLEPVMLPGSRVAVAALPPGRIVDNGKDPEHQHPSQQEDLPVDASGNGLHEDGNMSDAELEDQSIASLAVVLGSRDDIEDLETSDQDSKIETGDSDMNEDGTYQGPYPSSHPWTEELLARHAQQQQSHDSDRKESTLGSQLAEEWLAQARDAAASKNDVMSEENEEIDYCDEPKVASSPVQSESPSEHATAGYIPSLTDNSVTIMPGSEVPAASGKSEPVEWLSKVKDAVSAVRSRGTVDNSLKLDEGMEAIRREVERLKSAKRHP